MPSLASPRILLIRRRYLGDVVLLGSVIQNLRSHWLQAHLAVLVEPNYADILSLNPHVDQIIRAERRPLAWLKLALQLRRARFTHVLDFDNRRQTAYLTRLTGAPVRIALHHGPDVCLPSLYTKTAIAPADFFATRHITDYYNLLALALGIPTPASAPRLEPAPADLAFIRQLPELASLPTDRPRILIHPGSRSAFRIWPAPNFASVCDQLQERGLASITFVGGPAEQPVIEAITQAMRTPSVWLRRPLTSPQLAALFSHFDRLLCHDSGPMHVAAAVGTPVVALFGSQSRSTWGPSGTSHVTLQAALPCAHCVAPTTCIPHDSYNNYCVRNIPTTEVFENLASTVFKAPTP